MTAKLHTLAIASCCAALAAGNPVVNAAQCATEIEMLAKMITASDAGSGPTTGAVAARPGSETPQHAPTAALSQTTQGIAASPQDVQRQTQGQPTAAEQGQGNRPPASAGPSSAQAALDRARDLDRQGKEGECMAAVADAKRQAGVK